MSKKGREEKWYVPEGIVCVGYIAVTRDGKFQVRYGVLREKATDDMHSRDRTIIPVYDGISYDDVDDAIAVAQLLASKYKPFKLRLFPIPYKVLPKYGDLYIKQKTLKKLHEQESVKDLPFVNPRGVEEFVGFIKVNKNGRMRTAIGKLIAVDGPHADRLINILMTSDRLFEPEEEKDAITFLTDSCNKFSKPIFKISYTPVKSNGMGYWESMLKDTRRF